MKTSGQNHLIVPIITFLMCVIQVNGATLTITASTPYPNVSTSAYLTCHIPSFTGGAEWYNNGLRLTRCLPGLCIPPSSTRYQYSADATTMNVTIPSLDIALDDTTWTCLHDGGTDMGNYNLTVYKLASTLYINGPNSSVFYDGVTVHLSVSTGCIHPSGSAHYTVTWKYVEATSAAENNFGTIITQTSTSVGGCPNTYEDNLMFNLYLTNKMNMGNTTLYISQVKMTFTMAGINFYASKNVAYNVTSNGTTAPTPNDNRGRGGGGGGVGAEVAGGVGGGVGGGVLLLGSGALAKYLYNKKKKKDGNAADGEDSEAHDEENKGQESEDAKSETKESEQKNSSCDVSRRDVEIKMEENGVKGDVERPQVTNNRIGNKDVSETQQVPSKHFDLKERRPLPPLNQELKDKPNHGRQLIPSEKNDVKDQNLRGLSANFDDTRGLASETPRRSKLPPIQQQVQSTVQEEGTSEEPKKNKKNRRKKDKTDEGNSADEIAK